MERWVLVLRRMDRDLVEWVRLLSMWRGGPSEAYVEAGLPSEALEFLGEAFKVVEEPCDDCLYVVDSPPKEVSRYMGEGLYILDGGRVAAYISGEAVPRIGVD